MVDKVELSQKEMEALEALSNGESVKEGIDPSTVKKDKKGISLSKSATDFDKKNKIKEDVEQLDELSKKTLGSYVKKASREKSASNYVSGVADGVRHAGALGSEHGHGAKKLKDYSSSSNSKSIKRSKGIEKAVDKLTKEDISETQWEEMSDDDFDSLVENFELLSELSKKTLGSYRDKASSSVKSARSQLKVANSVKSDDKDIKSAVGTVKKDLKRKINNRVNGMLRSTSTSYHKEDISESQWENMSDDEFNDLVESFEELNELSKKTLGSYVKKAVHDAGNKYVSGTGHSKDGDESKKLGASRSEVRGHYDQANKDFSKAYQRRKGISKAVDKLTKEDTEMKEAIDQSTVKKDKKGISLSKNASEFDKKNKIKEDVVNEGDFPLDQSSTADNLKPNAAPIAQPKSKLEVMKAVVGSLADMDDESYTKFFNAVWPTIQKTHAGMDNAAANRATLKPANEEFAKLFTEDGLTEDFKEQAKTLFETAVHLEVSLKTAEIQEAYEAKLEEEVMSITEQVETEVNDYLDVLVDKFIAENEVAIVSQVKLNQAEQFVKEAKELFAKYNIDLDEEEVSQVEELQDKIDGLQEMVNDAIAKNKELVEKLNSFARNKIVDEIAEGLADTQKDRLATLSEAIAFEDEDTFRTKLKLVKDKFISESVKPTGIDLNEKVEQVEDKPKSPMSFYAQHLRK